jgi:hypothetical protein
MIKKVNTKKKSEEAGYTNPSDSANMIVYYSIAINLLFSIFRCFQSVDFGYKFIL